MTKKNPIVSHPGIVADIIGDKLQIRILSQSACASCHAKSMCNIADMEEKMIDVDKRPGKEYKVGDPVNVYMDKSLGNKAVLYAYFLPFIVVLLTLIILRTLTHDDALSGLIALFTLVPYYFILYLLRNKLSKTYIFKVY